MDQLLHPLLNVILSTSLVQASTVKKHLGPILQTLLTCVILTHTNSPCDLLVGIGSVLTKVTAELKLPITSSLPGLSPKLLENKMHTNP